VNEPTDGIRIYRKKFLEEIGGYPITDASDDIILAKAKMKNYIAILLNDLWGYLIRPSGSTLGGKYNRGKFDGYRLYIEHYNILMLLFRLCWDFFDSPIHSIGEMVGYMVSIINKKCRIKDEEVIEYYQKIRFSSVIKSILGG
jgi:hypothetical protein